MWLLVGTLAVGIPACALRTPPPTPPATVRVGADRLFGEYAHLIDGKRLALVTNHSGRLSDGTHLADTLSRYQRARLQVLFGMSHDVRSNDYAQPRDPETTVDRATGLPKHNLYGAVHKPTPGMLGDTEVILVDIQDVGARFYEHINILGFVMEAAAESGREVIVLDRPNPITGTRVDGFVTDTASYYRFGSYGPMPVVPGLTLAEAALFYNGERLLRGGRMARLHVVPMTGWRRAMWFDETGLEWRKPSPNLLTLHSLLAYIGTCLFEAVNVSEGRGSDTPFEVIGAAWLNAAQATDLLNRQRLPGVTFEPLTFTPTQRAFHGSPPELAGVALNGIRLRVTDREVFQPYRAGIALLWAVHTLHPERLVWNEAVLDRLVATPRLRAMLDAGRTPAEIFASWEAEVAAYEARRAPYLLYE
jgi:uncharacterized protein YbbC (DUF1343 family)